MENGHSKLKIPPPESLSTSIYGPSKLLMVPDPIVSKIENGHSKSKIPPPVSLSKPLYVPSKLLMGPGPTNVSQRVLTACGLPVVGHMHKEYFQIMDDVKAGLQYVFQTRNPWTIAISGPGHLGMEAVLVNLLEPGESVVIGVNGLWGNRAADLAHRLGAVVHRMETAVGTKFKLAQIADALQKHRPKLLFLVHSESSSGVMQPLEGVGDLCQSYNCLLCVDSVASLGGVPFFTDKWKIDAVYTGSQKVIAAPPGLAPISFGPRAVEKIKNRKTPIKSFVLDMNLLTQYWACNEGDTRPYQHTPPVNLIYALREALAILAEQTLERMWDRHADATDRLYTGLTSLGLELFVENENDRLPTVTTVKIPAGVDGKHIIQYAMDKYMIEIAGGLGPTVGHVLRIGLMGQNACAGEVIRVLQALKEGLEFAKLHGRL